MRERSASSVTDRDIHSPPVESSQTEEELGVCLPCLQLLLLLFSTDHLAGLGENGRCINLEAKLEPTAARFHICLVVLLCSRLSFALVPSRTSLCTSLAG